jgi:hypothetical protein
MEHAQFIPAELTAGQGLLVVAAACLHAEGFQLDGNTVRVESLETRVLQGGYSGAHVVTIRINRDGKPVVAKLSSKDRIRDEIRRFRAFIEPWDDKLRPHAYFHSDSAAILFGLVPDPSDPHRPAPSLESELIDLWNAQLFAQSSDSDLTWRAHQLAEGIHDATRALRELNVRISDQGYHPFRCKLTTHFGRS